MRPAVLGAVRSAGVPVPVRAYVWAGRGLVAAPQEVELVPSGSCIRVTFGNRGHYCDLVEHFRLHEFDAHVAAIRRGIGHVVRAW